MSRLPQPSSRSGAKSPFKTSASPTPSARATPTPPAKPRIRTQSAAPAPSPRPQTTLRSKPSLKSLKPPRSPTKSPARKTQPLPPDEDVPPTPPLPQLSIREQIALRRAEVKKATAKPTIVASASAVFDGLEDASPHAFNQPVVDVDLGRWSIKETIERGRSSGAINLSSRDLPCLPSALFEIHLGIKSEPLKSVPVEPPITTASSTDFLGVRRKGSEHAPSWYEAQDLEILKAWSNEILELQPELSMFGSLKIVDLHNNKLTTLPDSFADLTALTNVDLSQNELTSLPTNFWTLPNITHLNLSHNALTALPFSAPFAKEGSNPLGRTRDTRGDFFAQSISRATEPLPRLTVLEVSHNHLSAVSIDHDSDGSGFPALLSKLDLSENPLGRIDSLLRSLGRLARLKELRMQRADVGDESFPVSVFANCSGTLFPALKVLDLEETHVTLPAIEATFIPNVVKQTLQFDVTNQEPPDGVLRVILGKRVVKESWEIEAERRAAVRRRGAAAPADAWSLGPAQSTPKDTEAAKEPWEIEAEQGLLTEGAKRRMRALATANAQSPSAASTSTAAPSNASRESTAPFPSQKKPVVVQKEQWEIDAEQGLLSVGARRRARAEAVAAAAAAASNGGPSHVAAPKTPSPTGTPAPAHTPSTVASALASPQYYSATSQTLTLPSSAPPSKAAHARSFSLASPAWGKLSTSVSELALAIPTPTLPLSVIAPQPLAQTLKVLILTGRRNDPCFSLPTAAEAGLCLPWLEELSLENCNLPDNVPVSRAGEDGADDFGGRTNEPLLPLLAKLFPSVRTLDLSYNALTSAALTKDALSALILADTPAEDGSVTRKGLRHLRLRGNRLGELEGFQEIAERFRGNREVPEWKLEELDLRDNEIGKLPPELGMLPLDVFLVDGNV
ncbi:Leucine-rich repeat-containing protein 40 [Trametes pubescens]|uniref:Leucine-rich repeat-containing protein 40 n=1 Tax=Trametes pubescens TaxID=154538 RepID=A0A1M2V6K4_TRAPU|nr:Leucine-rich repeat-containing protein 40 [Trametes pubescens]